MSLDLVIRNGRLVTPGGVIEADLGVTDGRIAAIGVRLRGSQEIDATGLLVLPGAIDPHVHLQMPTGLTRWPEGAVISSDDWFTGTVAAACGGTTTVIDFVEPEVGPLALQGTPGSSREDVPVPRLGNTTTIPTAPPGDAPTPPPPLPEKEGGGRAAIDFGAPEAFRPDARTSPASLPGMEGGGRATIDFGAPEAFRPDARTPPASLSGMEGGMVGPLIAALAARRAEAEGRAVVDFGLHMTLPAAIVAGGREALAEVGEVVAAGATSFKTYLTYEGFRLSDAEFLLAAEAVAAAGGLLLVHAENDAVIARLKAGLLADGRTGPGWHPHSRPAAAEGEAVERGLALAEVTGCPLYVVHVSTQRGAEAVARARGRGQKAYGETCPQYLLLNAAEYDRPGFEGAKFVCSPPLRAGSDNASLWRGIASGDLSTVGTDHCPFFFAGQKDLGLPDGARPSFDRIPGGMPGIESRLALLYTYGVAQGRISLERWVEVCCTAPARIFGLEGRKGVLAEGADADVVLFDPEREVTLSHATLHQNCDYTPYDGFELKGYPVLTMLRGRVIARDGAFVGDPGGGQFLVRQPVL